mgnify:CR=1 FL=1
MAFSAAGRYFLIQAAPKTLSCQLPVCDNAYIGIEEALALYNLAAFSIASST